MAQWVLIANGNVVLRHSLQPLQVLEIQSPSKVWKHETFNCFIERRWGTSIHPLKEPVKTNEDNIVGGGDEDGIVEVEL